MDLHLGLDESVTDPNDRVAFVITSCGRADLLARTLDSFFEHNTHSIAQYVLIADSADPEMWWFVEQRYGRRFDELIFNPERLGQIRSIDSAYARVDTLYIFH